ncbi:thiamine pyrophosphate-dependent dehydrogenase E1 component subunit alpha (plasmid) [Mesorhizobium sp. ISC25]|uniref:thiamine pyrophosphate-dependent dehydrogenase E1 component subunit alpha n=1 Tax=Mesorhizobium sp. ISC25 TaxID=3077335 RepID=UPI0035DBBCD5
MQMSRDTLRTAYRQMRTIRAFEDAVNRAFSNGEIPGFVHLYSGQEACAVGVCMHLDDRDYIGSTHRGHGHCIAKGCDIDGMMMEIFGKAGGLCGGKGGSMHIADIERGMLGANAIVGGSPPLAVGAALTAKTLRTDRVAVAFTGDGGSNQGTMFEAMNMAVVLGLPVIFVVENNGYAEGTGVDYAVGSRDIASRAAGFGMPAERIDGLDFFAVHEAMTEAVARARGGAGPSFIEARCVRHHGHYCGDPQGYRSKEELQAARADGDPLLRFRARVGTSALLEAAELDTIDAEVEQQIAAAVVKARAAFDPSPSALLTDVYLSY